MKNVLPLRSFFLKLAFVFAFLIVFAFWGSNSNDNSIYLGGDFDFNLKSHCYSLTHYSPGYTSDRVGFSSSEECIKKHGFLIFNEDYVDFYRITKSGSVIYENTQVSTEITDFGIVFGLALFMLLSFFVLKTYIEMKKLKAKYVSERYGMSAIIFAIFILMLTILFYTYGERQVIVKTIPRDEMPIQTVP